MARDDKQPTRNGDQIEWFTVRYRTLSIAAFVVLVIGGLAMSAPVQSGLGAFHYIVSRGLLIVNGIPVEDGLAYALLTHESQLIFVSIIGTISFFIIFRKEKMTAPALVQPPSPPTGGL